MHGGLGTGFHPDPPAWTERTAKERAARVIWMICILEKYRKEVWVTGELGRGNLFEMGDYEDKKVFLLIVVRPELVYCHTISKIVWGYLAQNERNKELRGTLPVLHGSPKRTRTLIQYDQVAAHMPC
jgi:hypothetical protein